MLQDNRLIISREKENVKIDWQKELFDRQRREMEDSIRYASYIQSAILPPIKLLFKQFPDSFIYFEPKNMVSGDFYWFTRKKDYFYIAAADCTGHGVPGAFMSILGMTFLNEIVNRDCNLRAGNILNILREKVMKSLHQTGDTGDQKDGIDIALCIINTQSHELQYAGAFNPLFIIRNHQLTELKADKMPIGIHAVEESSFTTKTFQLKEKDIIYMFSDGYVDQFGGPEEKKFKYGRFKNLLSEISDKPLFKQYQILHDTFYEWKDMYDQLDDVLVIGMRYTSETQIPNQ